MLNKIIMFLLGMSVPIWFWYMFIFTIFSNNGKHTGLVWCMVLVGVLYPVLAIFSIVQIHNTHSLKWALIALVLGIIIVVAFYKLSAYIIELK